MFFQEDGEEASTKVKLSEMTKAAIDALNTECNREMLATIFNEKLIQRIREVFYNGAAARVNKQLLKDDDISKELIKYIIGL